MSGVHLAALVSVFLKPPLRLRAIPDDWARWLRPLWILLFGFSILVVVVSAVYSWRASYSIQPTIYQHGLDFEVSTDGDLTVGTLEGYADRRAPGLGQAIREVSDDDAGWNALAVHRDDLAVNRNGTTGDSG